MNDIEKAIEFYKAKSYEEGGIRDRYTRLAISALEKQMPKKVIKIVRQLDLSNADECPCCGIVVSRDFIINYCPKCGQKITGGC